MGNPAMTADQWQRAKELFEAASNLPTGQQEEHLRAHCPDDPALRAVVLTLLRNRSGEETESSPRMEGWTVFRPGDRIAARFRIVRLIAKGGMGEVYEAFDERLHLSVALKTMRPDLNSDPEHTGKFRQEVLVARELAHENICRIFDFIDHAVPESRNGGPRLIPCYTMELLAGETLVEFLKTRRPMPTAEALPLVHQICAALQYLHDQRIVHRDLKPSNIMIVPSAEGGRKAVVTDFGLARRLHAGPAVDQLSNTALAGAPYFLAPELLNGGRPSMASDIYALGLVIDEMVTRSRAFPGESIYVLYAQKLIDGPVPPRRRQADLPESWNRVLLRCFENEPGRRFQNASEVATALEFGVSHRRFDLSGQLRRIARPPTRRTALLAGTAIAVVGAYLGRQASLGQSARQSIILFPFRNETGDPAMARHATSAYREVLRDLRQNSDWAVYQSSTPRQDLKIAGSPVHYGLEGTLRRADGQLSLQIDILEGGDLRQVVWSRRFSRPAGEQLSLQRQVSIAVISFLNGGDFSSAGLAARQKLRLSTVSDSAFDAYSLGLEQWDRRTVESAHKAIQHFERALQIDPRFARAHIGIADACLVLMDFNFGRHEDLMAKARAQVEQAVKIDGTLPEARLALAAIHQLEWRWADAEREFQETLRLQPHNALARRWYGGMLLQFGRFEEALGLTGEAVEQDPYYLPNQAGHGFSLFMAGRFRAAIDFLQRVVLTQPFLNARISLGQSYAMLAQPDTPAGSLYYRKAIEESERIRAMETAGQPAASGPAVCKYAEIVAAAAHLIHGAPERARPHADALEDGMSRSRISPAAVAQIHALAGNRERALDLLEQAARVRDRVLLYLAVSPYYVTLHSENRFRALLLLMGLPSERPPVASRG